MCCHPIKTNLSLSVLNVQIFILVHKCHINKSNCNHSTLSDIKWKYVSVGVIYINGSYSIFTVYSIYDILSATHHTVYIVYIKNTSGYSALEIE